MSNETYVVIAVIATAVLLYVFETLRNSPPKEVLQEFSEARKAAEKYVSPEIVAMILKRVESVEKVAISETKKLLRQYADETSTPIDDQLCEWLDKQESKAP